MHRSKPLNGKKILIACSAKKLSTLANGLQELGATVLPFPVIEIRATEDTGPLDSALSRLRTYDWLIFTSVHGVIHFFRDNNAYRTVIPDTLKICAVGPATAKALKEYGCKPDLVPERFVAEGILEALEHYSGSLQNLSGYRFLLPRAKVARDVLPKALRAGGAHVDIVICYQTVKAELGSKDVREIRDFSPDLVVFTSSSTVINAMEIFGETEGKRILSESAAAAMGPITADTLKSFGKQAEIIPEHSTLISLMESIKKYYYHL